MDKNDKIVEFIIKGGDPDSLEKHISKIATRYAKDGFTITDIKDFGFYIVITFEG